MPPSVAELRISIARLGDGAIELSHEVESRSYYVLYERPDLRLPAVPVAVWLSPVGTSVRSAVAPCFYHVLQVSTDAPLDVDEDGIDDVFELRSPVLDPMVESDAGLDPDADGVDSLREYRRGQNPGIPSVEDSAGMTGLVLHTPLDPA